MEIRQLVLGREFGSRANGVVGRRLLPFWRCNKNGRWGKCTFPGVLGSNISASRHRFGSAGGNDDQKELVQKRKHVLRVVDRAFGRR